MTLSIVIPAYNAEAYLGRCLDSIFGQPYTDYEVLCIDDGSTDGTAALLRHYAAQHPALRVIRQANSGMATARNRGLAAAKGEYLLFVDSDDTLCPGALSTLAPALRGGDIVGFNAQRLVEATGEVHYSPSLTESESSTGWEHFNRNRLRVTDIHFVCIWQRAYRRAFLEAHGLRFEEGLRRAEDDLFTTLAMLHAATLTTLTDCLYTYHVRSSSITTDTDPTLWRDSLRVQRLLADTFIPLEGIDKSAVYRVLASNYINLFSRSTVARYGNHDRELRASLDWDRFRTVCTTPRHRRLYRLVRIHPSLLRLYETLTTTH